MRRSRISNSCESLSAFSLPGSVAKRASSLPSVTRAILAHMRSFQCSRSLGRHAASPELGAAFESRSAGAPTCLSPGPSRTQSARA